MRQGGKIFLKKLAKLKTLPFALVFVAGALTGGLIVNLWNDSSSDLKSSSKNSSQQQSQQERAERDQKRLEKSYDQVKADITEAVKDGKLTQEQADKLSKKLEEAYIFVRDNPGVDSESRAKIREKRQEWRDWVKDNKLPSNYIIRIY